MIKEFLNYLVGTRGYSHNTAAAYERDLRDFVKWSHVAVPCLRWSLVTVNTLDEYALNLTQSGRTPATINRRISSIRSLFDFMKRQGMINTNPARFASRQKMDKKLPNVIDKQELMTATAKAVGTVRIMLLLLVETGIRVQEMLDIEQVDIEQAAGRIKVHGKGNKERYVYMSEQHLKEVAEYAQGRGRKIFGEITQRSVRMALYEHLRRYSKAGQLSPHAIRHTYATEAAKAGANVSILADLLGHESIQTTQKYINLASTDGHQTATRYNMFN